MVVQPSDYQRGLYAEPMADGDSPTRPAGRAKSARLVAGVVVALLLAGLAIWLLRPPANTPVASEPSPTPSPTTPSPSPSPTDPCADQATEPIRPTRITFPGIARNLKVVALPRDANNVPSVPPTSAKRQVAWDRPPGLKPGSPKGNVLLNAHTWPDGSALGNHLLDELDKGDRIIVRGEGGTLCYEVDREVEVRAANGFPEYYDREGPAQLALLVCSGQRLGPGNWTHRTIWFAKPV